MGKLVAALGVSHTAQMVRDNHHDDQTQRD